MRSVLTGLLAILIACAFVLPAAPTGFSGKSVGLGSDFNETKDNSLDSDDKATDDETDLNETMSAGGGGWYRVNMSGTLYKDTFAVCIDGNPGNWSKSSLVLQARDQNATIHAVNFTNIVFDNTTVENMTYVHAWGWAKCDKAEGFWFHLVIMDNGTRSSDLFDLTLYNDSDGNWTMDETAPLFHWVFDGLGGGNIWVTAEEQESADDQNAPGPANHNDEDNEADDDDMDETSHNETLLAGGGGWHAVNMSSTIYKDTFGVYINGNSSNWSESSFVFQARDKNATIHAVNFTNIVFDNTTVENMTYVHAWGWAKLNKVSGFWFHLVLMDNGTRSNDLFNLTLYKDSDGNWTMDETAPTHQWIFEGLDGGNIWVGSECEDSET